MIFVSGGCWKCPERSRMLPAVAGNVPNAPRCLRRLPEMSRTRPDASGGCRKRPEHSRMLPAVAGNILNAPRCFR
ncbi:MAG: hypothetical protein LBJ67_17555 [Planctomycetaceae bacterium]|nr:hypothetical protein [Planctomycetaceae bacterium]